jgi:hypothetical protein
MKIVSVICNICLFLFSLLIFKAGGPPTKTVYVVFALWLISTIIINLLILSFFYKNTFMRNTGVFFNIVFIGFVCYAIVEQHPFPPKAVFYPFAGLMLSTPILSISALLRSRTRNK